MLLHSLHLLFSGSRDLLRTAAHHFTETTAEASVSLKKWLECIYGVKGIRGFCREVMQIMNHLSYCRSASWGGGGGGVFISSSLNRSNMWSVQQLAKVQHIIRGQSGGSGVHFTWFQVRSGSVERPFNTFMRNSRGECGDACFSVFTSSEVCVCVSQCVCEMPFACKLYMSLSNISLPPVFPELWPQPASVCAERCQTAHSCVDVCMKGGGQINTLRQEDGNSNGRQYVICWICCEVGWMRVCVCVRGKICKPEKSGGKKEAARGRGFSQKTKTENNGGK